MNKRLLILGIALTCIITICLTGCTSGGAEKITPSNPLIVDMSPEESVDTVPAETSSPDEQAVTESWVRTALQELSGTGVVSADHITKIEFLGGEDNPYGTIIHIYFQPDAVWDEEDAVIKAVHTSIKAMEILFENDGVAKVVMSELMEFTDKYGETTAETAVRIAMTKEVADKIVDWENVDDRAWGDYVSWFDLAQLQDLHPAIWQLIPKLQSLT